MPLLFYEILPSILGGTLHFPKIKSKPRVLKDYPGIGVTPTVIRSRYSINSVMGQAPNNKQAVAQFLEQYYDEFDLEEFFLLLFPQAIGNTVDKIVGDNYWYDPGVEANLDIQYIMSVGADIKTWFYSTPGLHENQVNN